MVSEILNEIQSDVASLELIPSAAGRFEWTVDGELVYSKAATGPLPGAGGAQGGGLREAAGGGAGLIGGPALRERDVERGGLGGAQPEGLATRDGDVAAQHAFPPGRRRMIALRNASGSRVVPHEPGAGRRNAAAESVIPTYSLPASTATVQA